MSGPDNSDGKGIVLLGRGMPRNEQADTLERVQTALLEAHPDRIVRLAFLEMTRPGLREVLRSLQGEGLTGAIVVPLFVPYDRNVKAWLPRAVSQWLNSHETGGFDVVFAPPALEAETLVAATLKAVKDARTMPSARTLRPLRKRPGSSDIPQHARHVLVCVGPRCVEAGAWETYDDLRSGLRERGLLNPGMQRILVTRTACQHPCNMAPLVTVYPDAVWYGQVDAEATASIIEHHLMKGKAWAPGAHRAGEIWKEDPLNRGDLDDLTASADIGAIAVSGAFARRAMHLEDAGAIFMTITNTGDGADTLLSAEASGATRVWVHDAGHDDDENGLPLRIEPGQSVTLRPGGLHMMLENLMTQLGEGQDVEASLHFERAGTLHMRIPINHPQAMMGE